MIQKVQKMRADGVSIREIGKKLNLQQHTVQYLLKKAEKNLQTKIEKQRELKADPHTPVPNAQIDKYAKIGRFTIVNLTHGYGLDPFEVQMVLALAIAMNATAMHEVSEETSDESKL
jgi:DNA-binding transcriptional regulator LsrR (DeoR family)